MAHIQYWYSIFPGSMVRRPIALAKAINLLNGKSREFLGILDSGADSITLTADLSLDLEIDLSSLRDLDVSGVHGMADAKAFDFINIALVETPSGRLHFPNGDNPVPLHFSLGSPHCLLGRDFFLNHCKVTFDGPKELVTIDL